MRFLKVAFLLIGVSLLVAIVINTDLRGAIELIAKMSWGIGIILGLFFVAFLGDVLAWQLTLRSSVGVVWFCRLWLVRMIGEAFNYTLPAGGMGGEPVKAVLLKRYFRIDYDAAIASLILIKTVNLIALIAFLSVGFGLMHLSAAVDPSLRSIAGIGLLILVFAITAFFAVQRFGLISAFATSLNKSKGWPWVENAAAKISDVEIHFKDFYGRSGAKFLGSLFVAFAVWCIGVAEIYATLHLLGFPVSMSQAWVIEAAAQLIRSGTFFIPASIGAQEGIFVIMCGIFTGSPTSGLAAALVRRIREIVWVSAGFLLSTILPKIKKVSSSI
ncbi:MAG: hypothetical protein CMM52_03295 [Rhodospirillaceae bacterium]|nr:hypothetical protein [Rhodospirillaceae bacterium]|tara:strand:+ start:9627 stop:10613 length:987 start_codon:yes stop_codon:yes gene_type:complete